jgi:hypothetical protein
MASLDPRESVLIAIFLRGGPTCAGTAGLCTDALRTA